MSVSDEFRRLLLHAAERLAEEEGTVRSALAKAVKEAEGINRYDWYAAISRLESYVAASTYAQLVMEMTATFLTDASESHIDERQEGEGDARP